MLFGLERSAPAQTAKRPPLRLNFRGCDRPTPPTATILFTCETRKPGSNRRCARHIQEIDASLLPAPVYGQVPAFAAADRGVLDLLAIDHRGRLAVIELKASEDFICRCKRWITGCASSGTWNVASSRRTAISRDANSARAAAPAAGFPGARFHPSNECVLRYFSPRIPVERIGVGLEWRKELKVMLRSVALAEFSP